MDHINRADSRFDSPNAKKQLLVFLLLTFGLTYALNFAGLALYGPIVTAAAGSKWGALLGFQMLIPASAAIACLIVFQDHRFTGANRWFLLYFLLFTGVNLVLLFVDYKINLPSGNPAGSPYVAVGLAQIIPAAMGVLGFVLLVVFNIKRTTRYNLSRLGLSLGNHKQLYLLIPLLFALLLVCNDLLNYPFKMYNPGVAFDPNTFGTLIGAGLINGIIANWPYFFGEEFGWRGYLQERLLPLYGMKRGVIWLGLIWGLWHAPVIAAGYNYPGHPVAGVISMILFCITIGIFFSYAVIKTGSVWIAALLHMINNTVLFAAMNYLYMPQDTLLSFGMGIYGIAFMAIFALILMQKGNWLVGGSKAGETSSLHL